jgi:hypothetical protein
MCIWMTLINWNEFMNMNSRNNHPIINPAIQTRIDFFECLESDVKKASVGSELRILYEKFGNYCANLKIVHAFGNITLSDNVCNIFCFVSGKSCLGLSASIGISMDQIRIVHNVFFMKEKYKINTFYIIMYLYIKSI